LREYRIQELMKAEVQRQIDELADDGFIVPSTSPMASPLVCVLKAKDGKGSVRLAVDYKYVNSFTQNDNNNNNFPTDHSERRSVGIFRVLA